MCTLQKVNVFKVGRKIVFSYPLVAQTDMPQKMKLGPLYKLLLFVDIYTDDDLT